MHNKLVDVCYIFKNTEFPLESLGGLSIFTGSDKSPGIRHVSKNLALTVYSQACKEEILPPLVDSNGTLSNSWCCKRAFLLLFARIYFHMYRVFLLKLEQINWDSIATGGVVNFKLLREIGYQYAQGQLEKVPPVDGVLDQICARSIYQANEYDQIFQSTINYLDQLHFGFEECKGGLRPQLYRNANSYGNIEPAVVLRRE